MLRSRTTGSCDTGTPRPLLVDPGAPRESAPASRPPAQPSPGRGYRPTELQPLGRLRRMAGSEPPRAGDSGTERARAERHLEITIAEAMDTIDEANALIEA